MILNFVGTPVMKGFRKTNALTALLVGLFYSITYSSMLFYSGLALENHNKYVQKQNEHLFVPNVLIG